MNKLITPVVLSGGMGTRLWPMSRIAQPKQFQSLDGNGGPSLLQATVARHCSDIFSGPLLVGSASEEKLVFEQLDQMALDTRFIGEPAGRNTGPAVLAAALTLSRTDPEALMLVLPSDHKIEGDMNPTIEAMRPGAEAGHIVLFGIMPVSPETGFGYITAGNPIPDHAQLYSVVRFVEKPELAEAERLISAGGTFWATGISMMRADVIIREFERFAPETLEAVRGAVDNATATERGIRLDQSHFENATNEPTEKLIFENSDLVAVAPTIVQWNDVGAWTAIHAISPKTEDGNASSGETLTLDCRNSLIRSSGNRLVTVIGMDNVIIIDTPDALLVTNHANAQNVKKAVTLLKSQNRKEVATHAQVLLLSDHDIDGHVCQHSIAIGKQIVFKANSDRGKILAFATGRGRYQNGGPAYDTVPGENVTVRPGSTVTVWNRGDGSLRLFEIDLATLTDAAGAAGGPN